MGFKGEAPAKRNRFLQLKVSYFIQITIEIHCNPHVVESRLDTIIRRLESRLDEYNPAPATPQTTGKPIRNASTNTTPPPYHSHACKARPRRS